MNTNRTTTSNQTKTGPSAAGLTRAAGLAALAAGIIYAGIQPIHPPDVLASVTTTAWAIITPLKTAMAILFMVGITGIYTRQVKEAGWLGLAGFVLLGLCWALQTAFIFAEAFVIPPLATVAPTFIDGFFGIVNGHPVDTYLGALPAVYAVLGIMYMLGGLLFGIASFRARILPRGAAVLLAAASALTPLAAMFPHEIQRYAGVPVGLALAWLGYALLTERRAKAAQTPAGIASPQVVQSIAK
jgi:hypothetical protein